MNEQPIFAKEDALERVDQDTDLLFELVELFSEDVEEHFASLQSAIDSNDTDSLEKGAHSIKSAVGNLGAMKAFHHAFELETMGREDRDLSGAPKSLELLRESTQKFLEEIAAFKQEL